MRQKEELLSLKSARRILKDGKGEGKITGAAALLVASRQKAEKLGLKPLAKIIGHAAAGVDPNIMGIGPVPAVQKVLAKTGLTLKDIDVIELNEAFASQSIAVCRELGIDW